MSTTIALHVPTPRKPVESAAAALRQRLVAQTSTVELQRRLTAARQAHMGLIVGGGK